MWTHRFEHRTSIPPAQIWPVIADIAAWPEIDHNIDSLAIEGPVGSGTRFQLKPKGGPTLSFEVGRFEGPSDYSDICRLPGAVMETLHSLLPAGEEGTLVRVEIQITGPLAWFWGLVVGRKHAAGLPAQTERILARAGASTANSYEKKTPRRAATI